MEGPTVAAAMIAGLFSGLYAGLGLSAKTPLDRRAELWFCVCIWSASLAGALLGGRLGLALVLGSLVMVVLWSVLHFPNIRTLETPLPRMLPFYTLAGCLVTAILLGIAGWSY